MTDCILYKCFRESSIIAYVVKIEVVVAWDNTERRTIPEDDMCKVKTLLNIFIM